MSAAPTTKIEKIMIANVHCVTLDMSVRDAITVLLKNKISGAPVIDVSRVVVSVVSEGDLLKLAASAGLDKKIGICLQKLIKNDKVVTLKRSDSFADAYKIFLTHPVHRIIVTDGSGKLQGIVSRSNVLRLLVDLSEGNKEGVSAGDQAAAEEAVSEASKTDIKVS